MSSQTKDARWQLAHDMLQHTQFEQNLALLPYAVQEHILRSAQSVLEMLTPAEVADLAKRFGTTEPETVRLDRKYVNMDRLEELQQLNYSGENGTYILHQAELGEIIELAMDGLDAREGAERVTEKKILKTLARLIKDGM